MSRDLNQCNFIGRLGKDIEIRYMPSGSAVANFSIAVSDDYTKDGQKVDQTEWVKIVAFNKLAEICEKYLKKGSKVFVSGRFKTRMYEQDNVKKYTTEIVCETMQMLDTKDSAAQLPHSASPPGAAPVAGKQHKSAQTFDSFDSDEIPFN